MTDNFVYCPVCDEHVKASAGGDGRPFCPQCEELLPQELMPMSPDDATR
ncbi:MAG: hypothetical protein RIC55_17825 [Pirellulaceae bacterium]